VTSSSLRAALTCLAIAACHGDAHEDEHSRRFEQHCLLVQIELTDGLRALQPGEHHDARVARFYFDRHAATEWREVRFCAPEGVDLTAGCAPGEEACMAAQFTRSIVWMAWFAIAPGAVVPAP